MPHLAIKNFMLFLSMWSCCMSYGSNNDHLKIVNYNTSHGLLNNHVLCTFQDSRGLIWVGSYSGVQIFDGYDFQVFNEDVDGKELFSNHVVHAIAEDQNGNMWFGTEFGLNKYDFESHEIQTYVGDSAGNGLNNNHIRDILVGDDGLIWLGTYGGGLNVYNDSTGVFHYYIANTNDDSALQSNLINSFHLDKKGLLWISTENGGVSVFNMQQRKVVQQIKTGYNEINSNVVNCVFQDLYSNYWLGTWDRGLVKFLPDVNSFEYKPLPAKNIDKGLRTVRSITQTNLEFMWIGVFGGGLYKYYLDDNRYEKVELNHPDLKNSKQDFIWNVMKDKNDNVWISTFGSGVFMISKERNTFPSFVIRGEDSQTRLSVACFAEDKENNLWVGTYNGGAYVRYEGETEFVKVNLGGWLDNRISYIYNDSQDRIWIGIEQGVCMMRPDRHSYKVFSHDADNPNSISRSAVNAIEEDDSGNIWLGFWSEGINVLSQKDILKENPNEAVFRKIQYASSGSSIPNNTIWNLYKDSRGVMWISSPDKLAYFDAKQAMFKTLEIYSVSSIMEDESGHFWISSMGNGIYKLDRNYQIAENISVSKGFSAKQITGMLSDKKGRIWVGTEEGISVLEPESGYVMNFDKNHGLEFNEVAINSCLELRSGEMVFGGNEGFTIFDPNTISQSMFQGKVAVSGVRIGNMPLGRRGAGFTGSKNDYLLSLADSLRLSYKDNTLSFDFVAINYSNPDGVKFSYRLDGVDEDWLYANASNRTVTYANLKPGEYVFHVRASLNAVNWGPNEARLHVFIQPPVWLSSWAIVLYALLTLVLLYFYAQYRVRVGSELLTEKKELRSMHKCLKEIEWLNSKNVQLDNELSESQKRIAELTFDNLDACQRFKMLYNDIVEVENVLPGSDGKRKLGSAIKSIEQDAEKLLDNDSVLNSTVNLFFDDFQKRLSNRFSRLTPQDLRLCSYIRLNKSNKEIARLLNITPASLDTSRYRLRKKLAIDKEINLCEFLLKF